MFAACSRAACRRGFSTNAGVIARPRRALLYMPGSSPKMLKKGTTLDVDTICMDLEDAVAYNAKAEARANIVDALATLDFGKSERLVRINAVGTGFEEEDVKAVLGGAVLPDGLVLPKVEDAAHLQWLESRINELLGDKGKDMPLIGLIESGKALLKLESIASATPRLQALIFGADDYAADVGATRTESNAEMEFARNTVLLHCAVNGLQAIDLVNIDFNNQERLEKECAIGSNMGYTGKQIIHPKQIEPVQKAFSPSADKIEWARRVVEGNEEMQRLGTGAFALDGQMIDMPTVKQAEKLLARAGGL